MKREIAVIIGVLRQEAHEQGCNSDEKAQFASELLSSIANLIEEEINNLEQVMFGEPCGEDAGLDEIADWAGELLMSERSDTPVVQRTERGWGGHFCCAHRCLFRRNTLLEYNDIKIVVSTVGGMRDLKEEGFKEIGYQRHYETMAFRSDPEDTRYHDIDVSSQVYFESPWSIDHLDADDEANAMHEAVVKEISERLLKGESFQQDND